MELVTVELLRRGLAYEKGSQLPVYNDLDALAGTWTDNEADTFLQAVASFNETDDELWL